MFALTRYDSVIRALKDASAFSSASGVMMNDEMNQVLRGNTLCSDGADHQRSRRIIGKPLSPTALKSLQEEITSKAERLVKRLVSKGTFCAITELATFLPMDIVATAVGLPQDGRERMLVWAAHMFNCFGPLNDRARGAFPVLREMMHYASSQAVRGKLKPGSWADAITRCRGSRRGRSSRLPRDDDRLCGAESGHDHLRHRQRRLAVRQAPGGMAEGPRVAVPNSRSHQRDCADGSTRSILLPSADARLRYGRDHPSSGVASDRVLWRGESRRTQVSGSAQVRCDACIGRAHGIWLGTAHVCRPAFGEARNERHLLRLGHEGGAIPYPAGDSQPEQRPAWVQQADGFRRVAAGRDHGHQGGDRKSVV